MDIEPYESCNLEAVVALSLRAWAPVFDSLEKVMGADVFQAFYADGWRAGQRKAVETVCTDENLHVWVAVEDGSVVGFVAVSLRAEDSMGEIYMLAVDPESQRHGIGMALTRYALDWMTEAGMSIAMVETGGDPGHAPARSVYENTGFGLLPIARYFKKL